MSGFSAIGADEIFDEMCAEKFMKVLTTPHSLVKDIEYNGSFSKKTTITCTRCGKKANFYDLI